jgi:hypothetical protein
MSKSVCSMRKRTDNELWEVHYPSPNKEKRKNAVQLPKWVSDDKAEPICKILLYIALTLKDDPLIMKALPKPGNKKITEDCENDIIMRKYRDMLVSLIDNPEVTKEANPFVTISPDIEPEYYLDDSINGLIKNIKVKFQELGELIIQL